MVLRERLMLIKFWGVHGSLPRPGPTTLKYGGNTACVEVRCGNTLIIFDAGTGIRELGEDIVRRHKVSDLNDKVFGHIFFSHLHWDHVQGFPFFAPAFMNGAEFHLYGGSDLNSTIYRLMREQMDYPNFPVRLDELSAKLKFHDLDAGEKLSIDGVLVRTERLNHPGGSFGYRLEAGRKIVVYASDTEHEPEVYPKMLKLADKADILIYDSMFTPEQYLGTGDEICRQSWGHSTWEAAVQLAAEAGIGRLILFHHGNCDDVVAEIERKAKEKFPRTIAAYEGLEIEL